MEELGKVTENEQRAERKMGDAQTVYNEAINAEGDNTDWLQQMQQKLDAAATAQQPQPTDGAWLEQQQKRVDAAVGGKAATATDGSTPTDTSPKRYIPATPNMGEQLADLQSLRKGLGTDQGHDIDSEDRVVQYIDGKEYRTNADGDTYHYDDNGDFVKLEASPSATVEVRPNDTQSPPRFGRRDTWLWTQTIKDIDTSSDIYKDGLNAHRYGHLLGADELASISSNSDRADLLRLHREVESRWPRREDSPAYEHDVQLLAAIDNQRVALEYGYPNSDAMERDIGNAQYKMYADAFRKGNRYFSYYDEMRRNGIDLEVWNPFNGDLPEAVEQARRRDKAAGHDYGDNYYFHMATNDKDFQERLQGWSLAYGKQKNVEMSAAQNHAAAVSDRRMAGFMDKEASRVADSWWGVPYVGWLNSSLGELTSSVMRAWDDKGVDMAYNIADRAMQKMTAGQAAFTGVASLGFDVAPMAVGSGIAGWAVRGLGEVMELTPAAARVLIGAGGFGIYEGSKAILDATSRGNPIEGAEVTAGFFRGLALGGATATVSNLIGGAFTKVSDQVGGNMLQRGGRAVNNWLAGSRMGNYTMRALGKGGEFGVFAGSEILSELVQGKALKDIDYKVIALNNGAMIISMSLGHHLAGAATGKTGFERKISKGQIKRMRDMGYGTLAAEMEAFNNSSFRPFAGYSEAAQKELAALRERLVPGGNINWSDYAAAMMPTGTIITQPGVDAATLEKNGEGYVIISKDINGIEIGRVEYSKEKDARSDYEYLKKAVAHNSERANEQSFDMQRSAHIQAEAARSVADALNTRDGVSPYNADGTPNPDYMGYTAQDMARAFERISKTPADKRSTEDNVLMEMYDREVERLEQTALTSADMRRVVCEQYGMTEEALEEAWSKDADLRTAKEREACAAYNTILSRPYEIHSGRTTGEAELSDGTVVDVVSRIEVDGEGNTHSQNIYYRDGEGNIRQASADDVVSVAPLLDEGAARDKISQDNQDARFEAQMEQMRGEIAAFSDSQIMEESSLLLHSIDSGMDTDGSLTIRLNILLREYARREAEKFAAASDGEKASMLLDERMPYLDEGRKAELVAYYAEHPLELQTAIKYPEIHDAEIRALVDGKGIKESVAWRKEYDRYLADEDSFLKDFKKTFKRDATAVPYGFERESAPAEAEGTPVETPASEPVEQPTETPTETSSREGLLRAFGLDGTDEQSVAWQQYWTDNPPRDAIDVLLDVMGIDPLSEERATLRAEWEGDPAELQKRWSSFFGEDGISLSEVSAELKKAGVEVAQHGEQPAADVPADAGTTLTPPTPETPYAPIDPNKPQPENEIKSAEVPETEVKDATPAPEPAKDRIDELLDAMGFEGEERAEQRAFYADKDNAEQFEKDYKDFVGKEVSQPKEEVKVEEKKDDVVDDSQQEPERKEPEIVDDINAPMPTKTVKGKQKVDYSKTTPRRGYHNIYNERGLSTESADKIVKNSIKAAEDAIKTHAKKKPKEGTADDIDEWLEQNAAWEQENARLEAEKKYWEEVQNISDLTKDIKEIEDAKSFTSRRDVFNKMRAKYATDPAMRAYSEVRNFVPQNLYDACVHYLTSGVRFVWDAEGARRGLQQQTGWGEAERKRLIAMLSKDGVTPEKAVHEIVDAYGEDLGIDLSMSQEILNTLLDAISSTGSVGAAHDYIRTRLLEQMRNELTRRLEGEERSSYDTDADRYYDEQVQQYRDEHPELQGATDEEVIAAMERESNKSEEQNENLPATEQQPNDTIPNETGVNDEYFEGGGEDEYVPFRDGEGDAGIADNGKENKPKAPNGKPSNLSEFEHKQVRTPNFKNWWGGNWELPARVKAIKKLVAIDPTKYEMNGTPEETFMSLGEATNEIDGTVAKFDHEAYKKNYKEGGKFAAAIPALRDIFKQSIMLISEGDTLSGTPRKDGTVHKEHRSFTEYRQYIGKAVIDGQEEYVRFTVRIQKNQNGIHNVFVTDVDIYDNLSPDASLAASNVGARLVNGRVVDTKLEKIFDSAKKIEENSSKIVDENGEPLKVYHGTKLQEYYWKDGHPYTRNTPKFYTFKSGFFSPDRDAALQFAGGNESKLYTTYLDIKKPLVIDAKGQPFDNIVLDDGRTVSTDQIANEARNSGEYDGVIIKNVQGEDNGNIDRLIDDYIPFRPEQIKSATENNGDFSRENPDIRFRDGDKPTFYSNAAKAVENIKQNKANAEQWLAMIKKNGGLKSGEDKWMGLSQWLEENKGKSLTKEEVQQFIADNGIEMEEVNYGDVRWETLNDGSRTIEGHPEIEVRPVMGTPYYDYYYDGKKAARVASLDVALEQAENDIVDDDVNRINPTRKRYTTNGLDNKREIAFKVPSIEPYQEHDGVHFGPENEGKAVMWVRFGETTDADGKRVLVIDEIQSNRHQDAREKGYKVDEKTAFAEYKKAIADYKEASKRNDTEAMKEAEKRYNLYGAIAGQLPGGRESIPASVRDAVPAAPFEKNWQEVAMKRMLRLAAEEGFDKVAWTTGEQQAKRYSLGRAFNSIEREDNPNLRDTKRFVLSGSNMETVVVNNEGMVVGSTLTDAIGKDLREVVGQSVAEKMMGLEDGDMLEGEDLRIGGEGMKGFYDNMLPRFMDKYGKRWGVKTGTVELPNVEEAGRTMHSVDVTPEMKESVMEGQPLFRQQEVKGERFAEQEMQKARESAEKITKELGLDVEFHDNANEFDERKQRAKAWYDPKTGKIHVVMGNHSGEGDVVATMLHEGVAHYGLRKMFGKDFDTFLDNVHNNVDADIRTVMDGKMEKLRAADGGIHSEEYYRRAATEEYIADLAEDGLYNGEQNTGYAAKAWQYIKEGLLNLLRKAGINIYLSDNELRYILWKSHQNLRQSAVEMAKDAVLKDKAGIKDYVEEGEPVRTVAEGEVRYGDKEAMRKQQESKNFKNWFGDWENDPENASKVVDKDGRPLIMSHNTNNEFYTFDRERIGTGQGQAYLGAGFNFSRTGNGAYGNNEMKVYLDARNPLESDGHKLTRRDVESVLRQLDEGQSDTIAAEFAGEYAPYGSAEYNRALRRAVQNLMDNDDLGIVGSISVVAGTARANDIIDAFKKLGFDSTIEKDNDGRIMNAVVFDNTQIKSATDNNGDFSRENPDIRFRDGEEGGRDYAAEMRELMRRRLRGEDVTAELERLRADRRAAEAARSGESAPATSTGGAGNGEPPIEPPTPPAPPAPEPVPELPPTDFDRPMSPIEQAQAAAIKAVNDTKASLEQRNAARRELTASLRNIHKAMGLQKEYDRATVENVVNLCKMMVQSGLIDSRYVSNLTPLFTKLKDATGKQDLTSAVNGIMDVMLKSQERSVRNEIAKLLNTKGTKVDQNGVVTQAGLDIRGQHTMKELSEYMGKGSVIIDNHIRNLEEERSNVPAGHQERIDDIDDKILGSQLAKQFSEIEETHSVNISEAEQDLDFLKERYKAGEIGVKEYTEQKHTLENLIRSYRMAQADALWNQANALRYVIAGGKEGTRNWIEQQKEHKNEIRHNAYSDMEGASKQTQGDPTMAQKVMNMSVPKFFSSSLYTLQTMLKSLGNKHALGEGYLYNRFFRGWMENRDAEITEYRDDMNTLNAKAKELTGHSYFGIYNMIQRLPKMTVEYKDGGEMVPHELDQGQLGYAYMVNKMEDGAAALRNMGISEEKMDEIANFLDPDLKKFYDWLQDDFLAGKWEGMNDVHRRMFGADMDRVENYIPLKRDRGAAKQEVDISQESEQPLQSTVVGSIIKRVHSNLGIDLKHSNAIDVVANHLLEATHWKHFSEWKRDANTLLSDTTFRNKVKNSTTIYGSGDVLWNRLNQVFQIAGGDYKPKAHSAGVDKAIVDMARTVNTAKVSMRVFTATKQLLSLPVFASECNSAILLKNVAFLLSPVTSKNVAQNSFLWCMQNLPQFRERWVSRTAGETRLENGDLGWGYSRQKVLEAAGRIGLTPNAFIDVCTVAAGAKSIYEKRFAQYKKDGYSVEAADKKAKIDAETAFNESQQSSEKAFVSPIQVDRTAVALGLSTFRNASMGFERKFVDAIRNFRHLTDHKDTVEFMQKQMVRDGLTETQAKNAAERLYRRALWRSTLNFLMFGFGAQMAWNVGGKLPYLIFGDDDEEKKKVVEQAAIHAGIGGWIEGLPAGDMLSEGMTNWAMNLIESGNPLEGNSFFEFDPDLLTVTSDFVKMTKALEGKNPLKGATDFVNLLAQIYTGVNPQTFTDAGVAIYDACNGNPDVGNEALMCILRIMQCPQSQLDQMYIDELKMSAREAQKLTPEEVARRYAYYKAHKETPYLWWIYNQSKQDEIVKKYEGDFTKKLNTDVKEEGGTAEDYRDLMRSATTTGKYEDYQKKYINALSEKGPEALRKAWEEENDQRVKEAIMNRYIKDLEGEEKKNPDSPYDIMRADEATEKAHKIGNELGFDAELQYKDLSANVTNGNAGHNKTVAGFKEIGGDGVKCMYRTRGKNARDLSIEEGGWTWPQKDAAKAAKCKAYYNEHKDELERIYRSNWRSNKIDKLMSETEEYLERSRHDLFSSPGTEFMEATKEYLEVKGKNDKMILELLLDEEKDKENFSQKMKNSTKSLKKQ